MWIWDNKNSFFDIYGSFQLTGIHVPTFNYSSTLLKLFLLYPSCLIIMLDIYIIIIADMMRISPCWTMQNTNNNNSCQFPSTWQYTTVLMIQSNLYIKDNQGAWKCTHRNSLAFTYRLKWCTLFIHGKMRLPFLDSDLLYRSTHLDKLSIHNLEFRI